MWSNGWTVIGHHVVLETESGSSARAGAALDGGPISPVPLCSFIHFLFALSFQSPLVSLFTSCLHCCLVIAGQRLSLSLCYFTAVIVEVGEGNVRIRNGRRKWHMVGTGQQLSLDPIFYLGYLFISYGQNGWVCIRGCRRFWDCAIE